MNTFHFFKAIFFICVSLYIIYIYIYKINVLTYVFVYLKCCSRIFKLKMLKLTE